MVRVQLVVRYLVRQSESLAILVVPRVDTYYRAFLAPHEHARDVIGKFFENNIYPFGLGEFDQIDGRLVNTVLL